MKTFVQCSLVDLCSADEQLLVNIVDIYVSHLQSHVIQSCISACPLHCDLATNLCINVSLIYLFLVHLKHYVEHC